MFYRPNLVRLLFVLIIGLVVVGAPKDGLLADDDLDFAAQLKGWKVVVSPTSFSYDDEITIEIVGLPRNFPFHINSVTLGGEKVHVPSQGMSRDKRPRANDDGRFVFRSKIPTRLTSGPHYLKVDIPNIFVARTLVDLKPLTLHVSSSEIVPYQEVWVVGMGFTKPSKGEGWRSVRINETTSETGSPVGVTIGGEPVFAPYIGFPVRLGRDGSVFFKMIVPESKSTVTPGQVELRVIDSEGREGISIVSLPSNPKLGVPISTVFISR